jgi:hypothetical protein
MQTDEHTVPVTRDTIDCEACGASIGREEVPKLATLPRGIEIEICDDCAYAVSQGDYSTLPEVSQL